MTYKTRILANKINKLSHKEKHLLLQELIQLNKNKIEHETLLNNMSYIEALQKINQIIESLSSLEKSLSWFLEIQTNEEPKLNLRNYFLIKKEKRQFIKEQEETIRKIAIQTINEQIVHVIEEGRFTIGMKDIYPEIYLNHLKEFQKEFVLIKIKEILEKSGYDCHLFRDYYDEKGDVLKIRITI